MVRFPAVGLDSDLVATPRERLVTFSTDGPGNVRAAISDVSAGSVTICLGEGRPQQVADEECITTTDGSVSRTITDGDQHTWTVTLRSGESGFAPTTALTLRFRAIAPAVTVRDFRFQGTTFPEYNGVSVQVDARGGGLISVDATWTGGSQPYRLVIDDIDRAQQVEEVTGEGEGVQSEVEVDAASTYEVSLSNELAEATAEALLRGTISWP